VRIDLHTHSTASDGTDTPAALVRNAAGAGLDVVALTDHDTVVGCAAATSALPHGLTLVTGAELSCRLNGVSLHMLAYLFDPLEPALAHQRELLRDDRVPRARAIVDRLRELGVPITWERVRELAGGAIGRPHIATAMVEAGVVADTSAAFTPEWIGDGGRAHVDKHELDAFTAVRLIHDAGGVAVFAHPLAVHRGRTVPESAIAT
jgi:3',5'-nucleoside bisphosphate phosphatase